MNGNSQNENKLVGTLSGSGSMNGGLGSVIGRDGKSAYEVAVKNGFEGTEAEWLASLKGDKGDTGSAGRDGIDGKDGKDGYTPQKGVDYFDGKDGADGKDGNPGVYVGSGDMPEGYSIQIDPEGNSDYFLASIVAEVLASLPIYNGEVIAE